MPPPKCKRQKVQCGLCNSVFDSDYRNSHNKQKHADKISAHIHIPFCIAGAPKNPFEAADAASVHKLHQTRVSEALHSALDNTIKENEEKTSNTSSNNPSIEVENEAGGERNAVGGIKITEERQNIFPFSGEKRNKDIECLQAENYSQNIKSSLAEKDALSWLSCLACVDLIDQELEDLKNLKKDALENDLPNIEYTLTTAEESIKNLKNYCSAALQNIKLAIENMKKTDKEITPSTNVQPIEHDPGKRPDILTDFQRKSLINIGPCRPVLTLFPVNSEIPSGKQNKFCASWYKQFPHLEYSIVKDAAFCFVCSLFHQPEEEDAWCTRGVRLWHKFKSVGKPKLGKLSQHFSSESHKKNLTFYYNFLNKSGHIDIFLDKEARRSIIKKEIENMRNNAAVKVLIDVARTLAKQNIAFRGSDRDDDGNFVQIVRLVARHNKNFQLWLDDAKMRPYRTTYLSPSSQNEFIHLLSEEVREKILIKISESEAFSVLADTTPDISHKDIMSLVIRIASMEGFPAEYLLSVTEVRDKTGEGLANSILMNLNAREINLDNLCFQSYDFTSSMSGIFKGTQKMLSEKLGRNIVYIPCQAHRTNTVVENSCSSSLVVTEMFGILESLYVFFTSSTKRYAQISDSFKKVENALNLRNLSRTRWVMRAESLHAVWISYEVIVDTLCVIVNSTKFDNKSKVQASALYKKILSFEFLVTVFFMKNIMYKTKSLTEKLQSEMLNILDAMTLTKTCTSMLSKIKESDEEINNLISSAIEYAKKLEIDYKSEFEKHHRRRKKPQRIDENPDSEAIFSIYEYYRKEFRCVLDHLVILMNDNIVASISSVESFSILQPPLELTKCSLENVKQLTKLHPKSCDVDLFALQAELQQFIYHSNGNLNIATVSEAAEFASKNKSVFPLVHQCYQILLTAPVTVASNERAFSRLKFIKTAIRSTMADDRLESLMLLSYHKELTDNIDLSTVLEKWANRVNRAIKV